MATAWSIIFGVEIMRSNHFVCIQATQQLEYLKVCLLSILISVECAVHALSIRCEITRLACYSRHTWRRASWGPRWASPSLTASWTWARGRECGSVSTGTTRDRARWWWHCQAARGTPPCRPCPRWRRAPVRSGRGVVTPPTHRTPAPPPRPLADKRGRPPTRGASLVHINRLTKSSLTTDNYVNVYAGVTTFLVNNSAGLCLMF